MQRFNFIDFMVIELRFFKKNSKKMNNMEKHFVRYYAYLTSQIKFLFHGYFSHILHLDIIRSEIEKKMNKMLIYGFQWGWTIAVPIYTVLPYCAIYIYIYIYIERERERERERCEILIEVLLLELCQAVF